MLEKRGAGDPAQGKSTSWNSLSWTLNGEYCSHDVELTWWQMKHCINRISLIWLRSTKNKA